MAGLVMTLIKDLEVGSIYRHVRHQTARWIVLRKDRCSSGLVEIEYTTMESTGPHVQSTHTDRYAPNHSWPVELDMYLIQEEAL